MSICTGIPWGLIVHIIDGLFPIGKRGHFRISEYDRALVNQHLYTFGGLFSWGICVIERSITNGGFQPFEMYIILDNNTKAGKRRAGGCHS